MTRTRSLLLLCFVLACCLAATPSHAATTAVRQIYIDAANIPTNLPNVHTYPDPPRGLNPLNPSDEELPRYGLPTRPDQQAEPDHYAMWARAMAAAKHRWHGDLKPLLSGANSAVSSAMPLPDDTAGVSPSALGPKQFSNSTVAGVTLDNGVKTWGKTSFADMWTAISVPVNQLPFDNVAGCTSALYYSWSLAGFDGQFLSSGGGTYFFPGEAAGVFSGVDGAQTSRECSA